MQPVRAGEGTAHALTEGASIAANKLPRIRAALCWDCETARAARIWNRANVLVLSHRWVTEDRVREILDAWWTDTPPEPRAEPGLRELEALEQTYGKTP